MFACTALQNGEILLHPTDTIPGLSFDPTSAKARNKLANLKLRDETKPISCLVASLEMACDFWQKLPGDWLDILQLLWPAPLTVIWQASTKLPAGIKNKDETIGLRFPKLSSDAQWVCETIKSIGWPLPTTSVNFSGQTPSTDWPSACEVAKQMGAAIPSLSKLPLSQNQPSSVIRLMSDGKFLMLREGSLNLQMIESVIYKFRKN